MTTSAVESVSTRSAVALERLDGVQVWKMGLAPVNAVNATLLGALEDAITGAAADPSVSVVVLASGLRLFSAGADASWMAETVKEKGPAELLEDFNRTMDRFREVCISLRRAPFLVIAAIQGHVLAGGLELAAACDLRYCGADDKIQIGVPEMDLFGVMPTGGGGSQFLARLMGPSRALDFILSAKPITPAKAFELGVVDRLYERGEVLDAAIAFASEVAAKAGRIGVNAAKTSLFGGAELPLVPAMALDRSVHWDSMRRGNFLPGVEAFTTKFASSGGSK
jgi:enoyl-CoA hydratase